MSADEKVSPSLYPLPTACCSDCGARDLFVYVSVPKSIQLVSSSQFCFAHYFSVPRYLHSYPFDFTFSPYPLRVARISQTKLKP